MKSLILSLFLFISFYSYSQTISEKWNSLDNRYDYTDSNGNLIGYKAYNELNEVWQYTNVNSSNVPYNPYGNNLQLINETLSIKQAHYDKIKSQEQSNVKKVKTYEEVMLEKFSKFTGGYISKFLIEETYDPKTKKYKQTFKDYADTKIYFDHGIICFYFPDKGQWGYNRWVLKSDIGNFYILRDEQFGQTIMITKNFDSIIIRRNMKDGNFQKIYRLNVLQKDSTITLSN